MGVTTVTQSRAITFATTAANTLLAALPAGSAILDIKFLTTTGYNDGSVPYFDVFVNGTQIINSATGITFSGNTGMVTFDGLGALNPRLVANIGSTNALVTFTQGFGAYTPTAGAGVLYITYLVRNLDGTYAFID
jgi:hypothetical protein